ncbi:acyltransferase family protein [Qipengyuania sp. MTN3-11]|uniref:acyltransferase family protein n=1 Tax=Qipengyuania sp. MTN3-11 TaxID=3056557 RepID=UPI0036F3705C
MDAPRTPQRFHSVDALRGIAAIAVMLYHAGPASPLPMPGGYLAVDLFFALSGFVIAANYAGRLDHGMGFREFMWLRVARLWPMLALGALLGIVLHAGHAGMLFLLPQPKSATMLFPANPPLWSLLFEMIAYATFAAIWRRGGLKAICAITAVSGTALLFLAGSAHPLEGFGAEWPAVFSGFARLGFAFGAGVLICKWQAERFVVRSSTMGWLIPIAFLAAAALLPTSNAAGVAFILVGVPAFVFTTIRFDIGRSATGKALGALSYPLYCIHVPLIATASGSGAEVMMLAMLPALALWLDGHLDKPARAALRRILPSESARLSPA